MSEFTDVNQALKNVKLQSGNAARDRMVWRALKKSLDDPTSRILDRLSNNLKGMQLERGSHQPKCGELMAAEILFKLWLLLEGGNGGSD